MCVCARDHKCISLRANAAFFPKYKPTCQLYRHVVIYYCRATFWMPQTKSIPCQLTYLPYILVSEAFRLVYKFRHTLKASQLINSSIFQNARRFRPHLLKSSILYTVCFSVWLTLSLSFTNNTHFLTHSKSSWQGCLEKKALVKSKKAEIVFLDYKRLL